MRLLIATVLFTACTESPIASLDAGRADSARPDSAPVDARRPDRPDAVIAHTVGTCDALPAAGVFENITPPTVWDTITAHLDDGVGSCPRTGVHSLAVDPMHSGTVYIGTCQMGVWRSDDCGATWTKINTGRNA